MAADSMPRSDSSSLDEKMSKSDVNGIADEALNSEKHVAEDTAEATTQYTFVLDILPHPPANIPPTARNSTQHWSDGSIGSCSP